MGAVTAWGGVIGVGASAHPEPAPRADFANAAELTDGRDPRLATGSDLDMPLETAVALRCLP